MSGFGFVIFQKRTFTIIVGSLPPSAATHDGTKEANRSDSEEDTLGGGPLTYSSTNYKQYKEVISYTVIMYYHHIIH